MTLMESMARLAGKHTRGSDKPCYFLLHEEDARYLADLTFGERHHYGVEQLMFHGIICAKSPLAEKGKPLVVMREQL